MSMSRSLTPGVMASGGAPATRKERSSANATTEVGPHLDDTSAMAALVGGVLKGGGFILDASLDSGHGQRDQIFVWSLLGPSW